MRAVYISIKYLHLCNMICSLHLNSICIDLLRKEERKVSPFHRNRKSSLTRKYQFFCSSVALSHASHMSKWTHRFQFELIFCSINALQLNIYRKYLTPICDIDSIIEYFKHFFFDIFKLVWRSITTKMDIKWMTRFGNLKQFVFWIL